jgi:hypothetical protein
LPSSRSRTSLQKADRAYIPEKNKTGGIIDPIIPPSTTDSGQRDKTTGDETETREGSTTNLQQPIETTEPCGEREKSLQQPQEKQGGGRG